MNLTQVAAAVIYRAGDEFLLGRRPAGGIYGGWWEFPGGKLERGESARDALLRELREELGIEVVTAYPWIVREHAYEHAHVRLHFFRVTEWRGELRELQHEALAWQRADEAALTPMLPANAPVLAALRLPDFYAITHASIIGVDKQLERLETALRNGLRLVQLREPTMTDAGRYAFMRAATALCHAHDARVLVNGDIDLATQIGADGVHLPSTQLMKQVSRPGLPLVAASCHTGAELQQACRLGLDFVAVGSVKPTASHPGGTTLGWPAFAALCRSLPMPAYALGGLAGQDLREAWAAGAHGIAAIRAAWD